MKLPMIDIVGNFITKKFSKIQYRNLYDSEILIDNVQANMCDHVSEIFLNFFSFLKKSL